MLSITGTTTVSDGFADQRQFPRTRITTLGESPGISATLYVAEDEVVGKLNADGELEERPTGRIVWVQYDQLRQATLTREANGTLVLSGTSAILTDDVGLEDAQAHATWRIDETGCSNC